MSESPCKVKKIDSYEPIKLYKYLKENFDSKKVQVNKDQIVFQITVPFTTDYLKLKRHFVERFKSISAQNNSEVSLSIKPKHKPGPPIIVIEKVDKTFQVYSHGTICYSFTKGPQEIRKLIKPMRLELDDNDLDLDKKRLQNCARFEKRCGEKGFERYYFTKRDTKTRVSVVERSIRNLIANTNYSYLKMKTTRIQGQSTFWLKHQEIRKLRINKENGGTHIHIYIKDLLPKSEEIPLVFNWLARA